LGEVSPGLKVVPILVKLVNLIYWGAWISDVRYRLLLGESSIPLENRLKEFIEVLIIDVVRLLSWNVIIKWQC
jgi:hypothetical protein